MYKIRQSQKFILNSQLCRIICGIKIEEFTYFGMIAMKHKRMWVAWLLLFTGLFFTFYTTRYIRNNVDDLAKTVFTHSYNELSRKIMVRLSVHAQVLRSTAAIFSLSDSVTRSQWKTFVEGSKIHLNLPGMEGIGFNLIIHKKDLQHHIQMVRNEGFSEYTIKPLGKREIYTSIVFIEPFLGHNLQAFGSDMYTEPVLKEAMERARDKNVAALSGKVMLAAERGIDLVAGNFMYVPVYRKGEEINTIEQRRHSILGWVSSPHRMDDLMSGILESWELPVNEKILLRIFDGSECIPESLLFEFKSTDLKDISGNIRFSRHVPIDFNGHKWTLEFIQKAGNVFVDYISAWLALLSGIFISFLLFLLAKIFINIERKAQQKAIRLTSALTESEKRFQTIFEASPVPLLLARASDGAIILTNKLLDELFNILPGEAIGRNLFNYYVNPDEKKEDLRTLAGNVLSNNHEIQFKKADGALFWSLASFQTITLGDEQLLLSGFYDITKRKQVEGEIKKANRVYAVLSNINQAIIRVQKKEDKQVLFEEVCRIAVEVGKFRMAWIGIVDQQTKKVIPVASCGFSEDYIQNVNVSLKDEKLNKSPIVQVLNTGVHYLANNIANNSDMIQWRESALKLGYKSSAAFPINVLGKSIGVFLLYSKEVSFFDENEVKLLDDLVLNISFGIEFIETNYNRQHAEQEIRRINLELEEKVEERTNELAETNLILQRKVEERNQAENRIRLVYEASPYSIILVDSKGTIRLANDTTKEYFGYEISQLIGSDIDKLVQKAEGMNHTAQISKFCENPQKLQMGVESEMFALKKNGLLFPVEIGLTPIEIDGEMMVLTNIIDITNRKLAEDKIRHAQMEAEQANMAKSEFLSRMSHELRTPMNSILGFAQLMGMGELSPTHKKGVDHILKSGKHLLALINEVLDISKIEAGHISLSLEPIHICPLVREIQDVVGPMAAAKKLTMEAAPRNDIFVVADRQRLKQVLINLTGNAIKYNRTNGFVRINCEATAASKEHNSTIRISISDSGAGILPEDIIKLFNPFERIGAEKTETEGTGLGLAVAKKLVEAMNGTIGVESELGSGSTFWIELPQTESQVDRHGRLNDQTKPEPEKAALTGTVLYIEDNVSNIQLVEQILEVHRPGVRLITEMYGKNAVHFAKEYVPDLILLDLDLPDIHGSKVFSLLQSEPKTSAIPVIIISADAMIKQIGKLKKAGVKDYLTKPIDVVEFLKVVDNYLS